MKKVWKHKKLRNKPKVIFYKNKKYEYKKMFAFREMYFKKKKKHWFLLKSMDVKKIKIGLIKNKKKIRIRLIKNLYLIKPKFVKYFEKCENLILLWKGRIFLNIYDIINVRYIGNWFFKWYLSQKSKYKEYKKFCCLNDPYFYRKKIKKIKKSIKSNENYVKILESKEKLIKLHIIFITSF